MDALANALDCIRLSAPLLAQLKLGQNLELTMGGEAPPSGSSPFHYVASGQCRLALGERIVELAEGDMIILPHWPDYRLMSGDAAERFNIVDVIADNRQPLWSPADGLDSSLFISLGKPPTVVELFSGIFTFQGPQGAFLLHSLPEVIRLRAGELGGEGLLRASLEFMAQEEPGRPGYAATASRMLELLLVEALRSWALTAAHAPGEIRGLADPTLARVLHAIHTRPGEPWTLASLARLAARSRSSFSDHFAKTMGMTPAAYLTNFRCHLAEQRLMTSDTSVTKLAGELGYGSAFAFSRAFSKSRGITPARFRSNAARADAMASHPASGGVLPGN